MSTQQSNCEVQIVEVPDNDDDQEEEEERQNCTLPSLPGACHKRIKSAKGKLNLRFLQ